VTIPAPSRSPPRAPQKADFVNKEADVLKKTSVSLGLILVATAGAPLSGTATSAHASLVQGWHHHHSSRSHHRNHNWNGNRHRHRILIRIYIYNKNNNHAVAIARPERRDDRVRRDADPFDTGLLTADRGVGRTDQPVVGNDQGVAGAAPVS
jgi:Ni/Co efflux regulator RcnB